MSKLILICVSIVAICVGESVKASPTSHDFIPCHKMAVIILDKCLQDGENSCWSDSKSHYESCRQSVIQITPDTERIRAAQKLREAREVQ